MKLRVELTHSHADFRGTNPLGSVMINRAVVTDHPICAEIDIEPIVEAVLQRINERDDLQSNMANQSGKGSDGAGHV